jgi:HEAT repeat protein
MEIFSMPNKYPPLTIPLLTQLTDKELQSHYLNHVDRTVEIVSLLTQITDQDLVSKIFNLALEVDLFLSASLSSFIIPELQGIIIDKIDELEVPITLKIELLLRNKSKEAISYLCDLFVSKNQYQRKSMYDHDNEYDDILYSSIEAIIDLDPNTAAILLIENFYTDGHYSSAQDRLSRIAIAEADLPILTESNKVAVINVLGKLLERSQDYQENLLLLNALDKIGTEAALKKIRDVLYEEKSLWINPSWIQGLGIVGDTLMVEHLVYLLYFAEEYIDCNETYYEEKTNKIRYEAILGIERLGGDLAFEILHQSLYFITGSNEYPAPWGTITQALFRLDCDRILSSLEQAICSCDTTTRLRTVQILGSWYIDLDDRHLLILLNAIKDPDLEIRNQIALVIRSIIDLTQYPDSRMQVDVTITPQLLNLAITNSILVNHNFHHEMSTKDIRDRVVQKALLEEGDSSFIELLEISQLDRLISDKELIKLAESNYYGSDFRAKAIVQMGKTGDDSVLPRLISFLEDSESSVREASVEGIVELGTVTAIPTILSIAINPKLVMSLVWYLEEMRKNNRTSKGFDLFVKNRELSKELLDIAEKTIIDIAFKESRHTVMPILCLGAIGSSDEAVLIIDKILKKGYHRYDMAFRSLARIDNELAIHKISEYLLAHSHLSNQMSGELRQVYKLGIVPQLWKCEKNNYSRTLSSIIAIIQEKEGLYNPDFSNQYHPLFEPSYPRLRSFLLGDNPSSVHP